MLERFTTEARAVITRAADEAGSPTRQRVGTEHLLVALLAEDAGISYRVLHEAGLDAERVRSAAERLRGSAERILTEDDAAALLSIGIDVSTVLARIEESFGPSALDPVGAGSGRRGQGSRRGFLGRRNRSEQGSRFTERSRKILELSLREAVRLHSDHIGTEHLLLGLIRQGDSPALDIIKDAGISPADLRTATLTAMGVAE